MNKFKPKFLLFLALIFLATAFSTTLSAQNQLQVKVSKPWIFNFNFKEALYKTSFTIKKQEITGLLFIKKQDSSYRMVMLSELGLKYFDLEIFPANSAENQVHYVIEFLNRPKIVQAIQSSLSLLILNYPDEALEQSRKDESSGMTIVSLDSKNKKYLYFYYLHSGRVMQITNNGNFNENVLADFEDYGLDSPQKIMLNISKTIWDLKKVEK
jgi:hypothetical protein